MMCDGADIDDVLFHVHGLIEDRGWAIIPVGGDDQSWVYTIGFAHRFDHPEFVVVDTKLETAVPILDEFGERLTAGERFDDVGEIMLRNGFAVQLVDVDHVHIDDGLLNLWFNYYGAVGPPHPRPGARQVLLPDDCFCDEHVGTQARLDLMTPWLLPPRLPNRAARRVAERELNRKRRHR